MKKLVIGLLIGLTLGGSVPAAEWIWSWKPAPEDPQPQVEVCPLKYGKKWAYAIEIDDGPKWVRPFAVPFLADYHYTEAPPGVPGGVRRPFIGSVSVIAGSVDNNDANLNGEDLRALIGSGWGVMNHSFDHRANGWSGPSAALNEQQAQEDAFWSQAVLASKLPGGRAPSGAVYANGYTEYNRADALAACGIIIATRVGGSSPRNVTGPATKWMDFTRSYLDEKVWSNEWNKGQPMADFPGADKDGPAVNSLVIDFTHGIERQPDSANQQRWRTRLKTIEDRWGAKGTDELWCGTTAEVAEYARAAQAARVTVTPGKLLVSIPDPVSASALTLRLRGISRQAGVEAPPGGTLHRQGEDLVLTLPRLAPWGVKPPAPRLKRIYDGPAVSVDFPKPEAIAGVTFRLFGNVPSPITYQLAVRTAAGETVIGSRILKSGWVVGGHLFPILPAKPAMLGTGVKVTGAEPLKAMTIWALESIP
jgi:hypothetical protein